MLGIFGLKLLVYCEKCYCLVCCEQPVEGFTFGLAHLQTVGGKVACCA